MFVQFDAADEVVSTNQRPNRLAKRSLARSFTGAFKEKMLHLAVDDDGIAVAGKTMLNRAGGSKVLDCFYFEDPSILPCDGSGVHVSGGVEVGVDLDIDTLNIEYTTSIL